jgi:peptidylprolyl isomerase
MAARDIDGMAGLVCSGEEPALRDSVDFLEGVSGGSELALQDFKARTERSDGTTVTMSFSGRFVDADLGEVSTGGRLLLVREDGEWCVSGERDGFRGVHGAAADVFSLVVGGEMSGSRPPGYPGREWIAAQLSTPAPDAPPRVDGEVTETASGLRYVDTEEGSGDSPQPGQTVRLHYTLWLEASGVLIDSSDRRGEPFEFVMGDGDVIPGFEEGVSSMREGGQRRLIVPPTLGYGRDDDYGDIPINSTLVFDVELVEVR